MAIEVTPQAEEDVWQIWRYIALDNRSAADQVEREIQDAIELIGTFPGLGHTRPDSPSRKYRFWLVHPYLVTYRVERESVMIVRVLHGAQDLNRNLG